MKKIAFLFVIFLVFNNLIAQNSLVVTVKNQQNQSVSGADVYVFAKSTDSLFDGKLSETSAGVYETDIPSDASDLAVFVYADNYQSTIAFPDSLMVNVIVYPPDLSSTPKVFLTQENVYSTNYYVYVPNFNNYSSITINYGDGTTETLTTPSASHQFPDYGIYKLFVTAQSNSGDNLNYESLIVVAPPVPDSMIYADFVAGYDQTENLYYFSDLSYVSSGEIASGSWDFGDGTTYNDLYAEHQYSQPGIYTVTHTITDSLGNTLSHSKRLIVPDSSLANIYYMPDLSYLSNNKIYINGYYTENNDAYLISSNWIGQDNSLSNRTYEYFQADGEGIYAIKHRVNTTKHDWSNIYYTYIAGANDGLTNTSNFTVYTPDTGWKSLTVGFINLSKSTGEFIWDFGDGSKQTSSRTKDTDLDIVYHTYSQPGTYLVKLTNTATNASFLSKIKVENGFVMPLYAVQAGKVSPAIIENGNTDLLIGTYPNPANDLLKIITSQKCAKNIEIYTIDGKLKKTLTTSERNISVDISDLEPGIYILKISAFDKQVSQKFIKN